MNLHAITPTTNKATRDGFGDGITLLGEKNPKVVALTADLAGSLKLNDFIKRFPERFVQCGIAEANMVGVAAGLATAGFIPYTTTFANFGTGRVYDQIRQSVAYSEKNVKLCASHAGLTLGEDGATHQILEDIGLMKMLPNMSVVVPCDYEQTKTATIAIADHQGPVYLRFGRPSWPVFTTASDFVLGKAQVISQGKDISIFACGHMVWLAIEAGKELEKNGYDVEIINIHTIKPIDEQAIVSSLKKTKVALVAEEHNIIGGLGESIAGISARHCPVPIAMVGVNDSFGESGKPMELMAKYGLDAKTIYNAALSVMAKKEK